MEKKASIFLIILLCILVAVAGGSVSYAYLNKAHEDETEALESQIDTLETNAAKLKSEAKKAETAATQTTPTTAATTTTDPTASWKTYTGAYEGISLKYPSTWTFANKPADPASTEWPDDKGPFDGFTLTSPNNFQIEYMTHIGGLGGGCDVGINCPKTYFYSVLPLTASNYNNLQLIQLETREHDNTTIANRNVALWNPQLNTLTTPKTGETIEGIFYSLYYGKGSVGLSLLSGKFTGSDKHLSLTTQQYFNLTDVKEATEILKTVTFK